MKAAQNAHGVYRDGETIALPRDKGKGLPLVEVRVADTAAGWRAVACFAFSVGNCWGSYSPITDHDAPFRDRGAAVSAAAARLHDRLTCASVEPCMEAQRAKMVGFLAGLNAPPPAQLDMFA